jgi:hypothetical protein
MQQPPSPSSLSANPAVFEPYAPPAAPVPFPPAPEGALPGPAVALYSANQVALATFLGAPLGGAVVLALNERRLFRPRAAVIAIVLGVVASAALLGLAFLLPSGAPSGPIGLLPILVVRGIAQRRQRALVDAHVASGGKRASSWAAAGIGLACLAGILVCLFAIAVIVGLLT